ncbi:hypothetical protein VT85_26595 (plasmid) [Planctomyces sp. SH-PL62]|nr:hypothetical protein VT85_26595 [Planctomyces sp. SH-PL62]
MRNGREPRGDHSGRAAAPGGPRRARLLAAAVGGACALGLAGPGGECAAQSPFSGTPARSGAFTIPTSPSPASPFSQPPSPGRPTRPLPPGVPSPFARPSPLGSDGLPGLPVGTPELRGLPLPLVGGEDEDRRDELPPRPEVAPELSAAPTEPVPRSAPVLLRAGLTVTLRVCQLLPKDGFSPGERLLNGRPPIQPGDCFLAEVLDPDPHHPVLVGGTVREITPPGRFGRPGYVSIQMTQLVQGSEGRTGLAPWRMDLADRRFATRMRRALLTTLLGLEGAGTGASIGAQFSGGNMSFIGGGMGVGALVGLGYATLQRGTEANLEPGDTFQIVVGTTEYRPVSREWQTILYPAADPGAGKVKKR